MLTLLNQELCPSDRHVRERQLGNAHLRWYGCDCVWQGRFCGTGGKVVVRPCPPDRDDIVNFPYNNDFWSWISCSGIKPFRKKLGPFLGEKIDCFSCGKGEKKTLNQIMTKFLGATKHLHNWLCPRPWSVGWLVGNAFVRRSTRRTLLAYLALFRHFERFGREITDQLKKYFPLSTLSYN